MSSPWIRRGAGLLSVLAVTTALTGGASASAGSVTARNGYASWAGSALGSGSGDTTLAHGAETMGPHPGSTSLGGRTYQTSTWTSAWSSPGFGFTQLIPSWQATTPAGSWLRVLVRVRTASGQVSSWDEHSRWSTRDDGFRRTSLGSQGDDLAHLSTDTLVANGSNVFSSWQVRVVLNRTAGSGAPSLREVGAVASRMPSATPSVSTPLGVVRRLAVPAYSQMTHRNQYAQYGGGGEAWCSPTSTSMLLGYFHALPSASNYAWVNRSYSDRWVDHVARMTYDYGYQGTGNWPFNTAYAAQYLPDAFVTRLGSLRQAERFIAAGIPLGASIAFGPGQLSGAPISSTPGHLVVISGFTSNGDVVVNDPAASTDSSVVRVYDRRQFERAWLGGSDGMVYVVHDSAHPLPRRGAGASW